MKRFFAIILALALPLGCATAQASVQARLNQRIATRTGPGTHYTEPGSFLSAGSYVTVISKVRDYTNEIWWVQVEFSYAGDKYRAYTGSWRMDVNLNRVPSETGATACRVLRDADVFAGPGWEYAMWNDTVYRGTNATLIMEEDGYGLIECWNSRQGQMWRVWIHLSYLEYGNFAPPSGGGWDDGGSESTSDWRVGKWATITGGSVNCRTGAGTQYATRAYVSRGDRFYVYGTDWDNAGTRWYKICVNGSYLWVSSQWSTLGD